MKWYQEYLDVVQEFVNDSELRVPFLCVIISAGLIVFVALPLGILCFIGCLISLIF